MEESTKKSPKEPIFLLEMPHSLRHLIIKRGHILRSVRTCGLSAIGKAGSKAWLQARLIPSSGESAEETWDKAHELAGKFCRELHKNVYVEPGSKAGRYQSMIALNELGSAQINPAAPMNAPIARTGFAAGPAPTIGMHGVADSFGMGPNRSQIGFGATMVIPDIGMPKMLDPMGNQVSGLPSEVAALIASHPTTLNREVTCPILHQLPGWSELSESRQQMFETEAAQLIKNGLNIDASAGLPQLKRTTLDLVRLQPNVSKMLKHFLDKALRKAAD